MVAFCLQLPRAASLEMQHEGQRFWYNSALWGHTCGTDNTPNISLRQCGGNIQEWNLKHFSFLIFSFSAVVVLQDTLLPVLQPPELQIMYLSCASTHYLILLNKHFILITSFIFKHLFFRSDLAKIAVKKKKWWCCTWIQCLFCFIHISHEII